MATLEEISLCERVCRKASALGYRLSLIRSGFWWVSQWMRPDGERLNPHSEYTQERSLIDACRRLAPLLGL